MTKEQWLIHASNENGECWRKIVKIDTDSPDNWHLYKSALIKYIKGMDDLMEVYNMENKGKSDV
jgi:hypothetical protein